MFRKKTVIVVGAGASKEFGLPLGGGLTEIIANDVNIRFNDLDNRTISGDEYIIEALRQAAKIEDFVNPNINRFLPACRNIVAGMAEAQSIDTFINSREGDARIELVGKLGILRSILREENQSDLYIKTRNAADTIKFSQIKHTWLAKFRQFVCDGITKDKVADRFEKITLIVFNYDRCVEYYLVHSLRNYYGIDEKEALEIFNCLTIIHPYGVVGELPWNGMGIAYGETELHGRLHPLVNGIRTFTEQSDDTEFSDSVKNAVADAGLMIFLGFAFHDQNIELLAPESREGKCHVYGTALGISEPVQEILRRKLQAKFTNHDREIVTLDSECKCGQLFDKYGEVFASI